MLWNWRYADCVAGIRLLLFKKTCSRIWTTLSSNFERNGRLDTGLWFFGWLGSSLLFFSSGRITANLKAAGKQPVFSDLLNSRATTGDSNPRISFTSHVVAGSSWQDLLSAEPIRHCCIELHIAETNSCYRILTCKNTAQSNPIRPNWSRLQYLNGTVGGTEVVWHKIGSRHGTDCFGTDPPTEVVL